MGSRAQMEHTSAALEARIGYVEEEKRSLQVTTPPSLHAVCCRSLSADLKRGLQSGQMSIALRAAPLSSALPCLYARESVHIVGDRLPQAHDSTSNCVARTPALHAPRLRAAPGRAGVHPAAVEGHAERQRCAAGRAGDAAGGAAPDEAWHEGRSSGSRQPAHTLPRQ